jgi:hypothetical protein
MSYEVYTTHTLCYHFRGRHTKIKQTLTQKNVIFFWSQSKYEENVITMKMIQRASHSNCGNFNNALLLLISDDDS